MRIHVERYDMILQQLFCRKATRRRRRILLCRILCWVDFGNYVVEFRKTEENPKIIFII